MGHGGCGNQHGDRGGAVKCARKATLSLMAFRALAKRTFFTTNTQANIAPSQPLQRERKKQFCRSFRFGPGGSGSSGGGQFRSAGGCWTSVAAAGGRFSWSGRAKS